MSIVPTSLKGKLFAFLTFVNVGISSFFAGNMLFQQTIFSAITAILCLGLWYYELAQDDREQTGD